MGKKRGRPPKPDAEGTRMLRVNNDLADMIAWIVRVAKKKDPSYTAAQLVDPLLRPQILVKYKLIESDVERIKRAENSASEKASGDQE